MIGFTIIIKSIRVTVRNEIV